MSWYLIRHWRRHLKAHSGPSPSLLQLPETLPAKVLTNKARRIRRSKIPGLDHVQAPMETSDRSLVGIFKIALLRPWRLLLNSIAFCCAIYQALVYMLLYMLFAIYLIGFRQMRGWNAGVSGLPLLGTALGACLGGLINFYFIVQDRKKQLAGNARCPEDRLVAAKFGAILFPVAIFWFAWTANYNSIHWIIPTLAGLFLSTAIFLIFVAYLNYLVDVYLPYAASALAANTFFRACCGAAAPLFTTYMFESLAVAGGGSLIAGVACLLAPIPFVFTRYGQQIRQASKFTEVSIRKEGQNTVWAGR